MIRVLSGLAMDLMQRLGKVKTSLFLFILNPPLHTLPRSRIALFLLSTVLKRLIMNWILGVNDTDVSIWNSIHNVIISIIGGTGAFAGKIFVLQLS